MTCPSCGSSRVKRLWWRIWTAAYRCLDCGREWEVRMRPGVAVVRLRRTPRFGNCVLVLPRGLCSALSLARRGYRPHRVLTGAWWMLKVVVLLLALATPAAASTEVGKEEPPPSPGVGMGFLCTIPQGDDDPHAGCEPAVALPLYTLGDRPEERRWSLMAAVTEERAGLGVGYCSGSACVAVGVVAPWSTEAGWEVEEWRFAGGVSVGLKDLLDWVGR